MPLKIWLAFKIDVVGNCDYMLWKVLSKELKKCLWHDSTTGVQNKLKLTLPFCSLHSKHIATCSKTLFTVNPPLHLSQEVPQHLKLKSAPSSMVGQYPLTTSLRQVRSVFGNIKCIITHRSLRALAHKTIRFPGKPSFAFMNQTLLE